MTANPSVPTPNAKLPTTGKAGIFKLSRKDLGAMLEAAKELKLACFHVDLTSVRNIPGFIKAMKRDLEFPEWFGNNLDALNDCLTDFSWRPAPGYVITLEGLALLSASPTSFAAFNQVLASAVEEWKSRDTPFWVFYLTESPVADTASPVASRLP